MANKTKIITNGIGNENPVLRLILGTCPTLAVTTLAVNGLGMGVAATLVLIGSNVVISMLRKVIPKTVRIPAYIVVIAGFVTAVQLLVKAFTPEIDKALGIFLPLIVVNCIILGRAEMFASKNNVFDSLLDGLGMGIGFTLVLFVMGSIREILGAGTWMGITLTANVIDPLTIMTMAPGGFFIYGVLIAVMNKMSGYKLSKAKAGCAGCGACDQASEEDTTTEKGE